MAVNLITYINPNCLASLDLLVLYFVLQLRGHQTEHVLTTMEQTTTSRIVNIRLVATVSAFFH